MELVGGRSDINGATPSSFYVSVLLLASVERFGVSCMQDFCNMVSLLHYDHVPLSHSIPVLV